MVTSKSREEPPSKVNNVEDVLEKLGGFGKFQFMVLTLMLVLEIPTAFLVFLPVFIGATPSQWICDNDTVSKEEACSCPGTLSPVDSDSTVVAEWGLVCEEAWVSDTVVSVQMAGMIVGNLFVTQLSDWYGRRFSFLGITITMVIGSTLTALAPNALVYAFARFICGAGFCGFLSISAIYSMEFLTPDWRVVASVGPFGEGIMLLGLVAYFIRPWRTLVWATTLPFAAIIFIFPFIPESPRWLLRNQKIEECSKVLKYMARVNGREEIDLETLRALAEKERCGSEKTETEVQRLSYREFFKDAELRRTTLILQGIWFSWGMVYFGISYNIKNLAGSQYMNVVYMGLADAIGYPSSILFNKYLGRRNSLVAFMTLTAAFLVTIAILQLSMDLQGKEYIIVILCLLGKYGTAGARSAGRTLTGESFPTAVRTMGIGVAGVTGSVAAALSPQLAYLGAKWPSLPFFAFAVISVLGSMVSFLLKETSGRPMKEGGIGKTKKQQRDLGSGAGFEGHRKVSISIIVPLGDIKT